MNLEKSLDAGYTYFWSIHLDDGTSIDFRVHLKGASSGLGGSSGGGSNGNNEGSDKGNKH